MSQNLTLAIFKTKETGWKDGSAETSFNSHCNSSQRGSDIFFFPVPAGTSCTWCTEIHSNSHIHKIKISNRLDILPIINIYPMMQ